MRKFTETFFCILAIILIISFPSLITQSVKEGIVLCIYTVIPALLPFMLIVNFMQKHNLCSYLSFIIKPLLSIPFKISDNGCFAVIAGFSCGYPIGAKTISDLYTQKKITLSEACYLITFCNNCSLSFLINYIYLNFAKNTLTSFISFNKMTILIIFLIYFPAVITGIINRFIIKPDIYVQKTDYLPYNGNPILSSIKSLSVLSVYIICFTLFSRLISALDIDSTLKAIICGLSEITSGTVIIASTIRNNIFCTYLILLFTVFGGFSITLQSLSQINNKTLKKYYITGKLESMIIFSLLFVMTYIIFK